MYIYHLKSVEQKGNILYPLNQLKTVHPEVYDFQVAKYKGREALLAEKIPLLSCYWNDVLHFAPVHPSVVKAALTSRGLPVRENAEFYKVPLDKIQMSSTVIFFYNRDDAVMSMDEVEWLSPKNFVEMNALPKDTLSYYDECASSKAPALLYHRVPHILARQTLDTNGLEVIGW